VPSGTGLAGGLEPPQQLRCWQWEQHKQAGDDDSDDSDVEMVENPAPIGSGDNAGREDLQTDMKQKGLTPQQMYARLSQLRLASQGRQHSTATHYACCRWHRLPQQ